MKKYLPAISLVLFCSPAFAQNYSPFNQVRQYTKTQAANKYDSSLTYLTARIGHKLHYLYPLYQAIGWEDKFKKTLGEKSYYEALSQFISFTGDYAMASAYNEKSFVPLPDSTKEIIKGSIDQLKNIQAAPAKNAILDNAKHYRVIMINESHDKPVHRAFTYSLLDDLYKQGYRYLAMEALNNFSNHCLDSLNLLTGFYTNEPVAGELVRKALELGYKLVSYEDTAAVEYTVNQRDSTQAENIYAVIKKDPTAKILVHAGYGHICEDKIDNYRMMAWWFKKISGIDPFTVEQTGMTEGGESEFGKLYYQYFTSKFSITEPSIIFENRRPFNPLQKKGYDVIVVHPPTVYQNNRPSWLSLNGEKQAVLIQPTERTLFLVQAYYENEYSQELLDVHVPADQTYISNRDGYYCLYLKKGKYKIVMRDIGYRVLSVRDREVK